MHNAAIDQHSAADTVEIHRNAYNAAFYELGLRWHWDADIYQSLPNAEDKHRIQVYLETHQPHLLKAYDAEFLVEAIQATKARCYDNMAASGLKNSPCINWAEIHSAEVGS